MKPPIAFDPFVDPAVAAKLGVRLVELDELLRTSDFVSIHCPLTDKTRGLIGRRELALMKPDAYLINTARGGIVDEDALYEALEQRSHCRRGVGLFRERATRLSRLDSATWRTCCSRRTASPGRTKCFATSAGPRARAMVDLSLKRTAARHRQSAGAGAARFPAQVATTVRLARCDDSNMSQRLHNQVAWISGAASGIGEAVARLFAEEGAAVAIVDVQAAKGEALAAQSARPGGRAISIECDVARADHVRISIDQTVREFGGLSIMVNCAGIVQVQLLHELDEADWDRLMAINLKSIYLSIRYGLAHLKRNVRSYVVNVGSISSLVGQARRRPTLRRKVRC